MVTQGQGGVNRNEGGAGPTCRYSSREHGLWGGGGSRLTGVWNALGQEDIVQVQGTGLPPQSSIL